MGRRFTTYTNYFEYNFSWTVHHYDKGNTRPDQFYTWANAPEIVRVKFKSLLIIAVYSTMIVGLPLAAGFAGAAAAKGSGSAEGATSTCWSRRSSAVFVLATLKSIPDVTQVAQLGRYYLPVFVLAIPTAVAGVQAMARGAPDRGSRHRPGWLRRYVALVWADPTWAYDASWLVKPYQLHWPALAGGRRLDQEPSRTAFRRTPGS